MSATATHAPDAPALIWKPGRGYYRAGFCGYTFDPSEAGVYPRAVAEAEAARCPMDRLRVCDPPPAHDLAARTALRERAREVVALAARTHSRPDMHMRAEAPMVLALLSRMDRLEMLLAAVLPILREEAETLLENHCVLDPATHAPRRETLDPEVAPEIATIEALVADIEAALPDAKEAGG